MVHIAAGYARMRNRLGTLVCTSSIGPGATNMVTGAALATINRLPVLLLPGDVFASHAPDPVLQQLEVPWAGDVSVNDCFRPVSRYFDRISRPEQVIPAALAAMRVLTSPAETGAVTLAFPQDVQAEAFDCPEEFLARAGVDVPRAVPDARRSRWRPSSIRGARAAARRRGRRRHLLGSDRGAARVLRRDGHPGRRDAGGQGLAALRPPLVPRRDRRDRNVRREPHRRRRRRRDRDRDALQRLHDGVEDGVPQPGRSLRQRQRRRLRRREAQRHPRSSATRASRSSGSTEALAGWSVARRLPRGGRAPQPRVGRRGRAPLLPRPRPLPAQSEVIGAVNDASRARRRRRLRRRGDARRPAQALSGPATTSHARTPRRPHPTQPLRPYRDQTARPRGLHQPQPPTPTTQPRDRRLHRLVPWHQPSRRRRSASLRARPADYSARTAACPAPSAVAEHVAERRRDAVWLCGFSTMDVCSSDESR